MKISKRNKLTVIFFILAITALSAQNAPIDFEAGGYGADWTWTVFENVTNPPLEIIANPNVSAPNESATVAKFTALQAGQPWAGCESLHGTDIGLFNLNTTNSTIKIMVYKPVISDVGIKLVKPDSWSMGEIKIANTVVNEWEELTFDFTSQITDGYDQIVIFPDFDLNGRTQDNICYFDNITFSSGGAPPTGPEEPAQSPTIPEANVISLFSNVYTDVTVDTWSTDWDAADVQDAEVAGDDMKLYTNLVFAGIEFSSQTIDASNMTNFCLDIWTPDATAAPAVFKIKLVDFGADGIYGGGDDVEHELIFDETTTPALATEEWIHFDISMADFTNLVTNEHLAQLILAADPGPNTVYVDNVYFYNNTVNAGENSINIIPAELGNNFPNPFNPITTISYTVNEAAYVSLNVYDVKGRLIETLVDKEKTANTYQQVWNAENATSGVYFYQLKINNKAVDTKRMILLK